MQYSGIPEIIMNTKTILTAVMLGTCSLFLAACANTGHEQSAGEYMSDAALTTRVKSALLRTEDINSMDIEVETYNGHVQLSGFVDSDWQVSKAEEVARSISGVKKVTNSLTHKRD